MDVNIHEFVDYSITFWGCMWQAELTALERCYAAVMIALYKSLVLHSRCEESLVNNRSTVDQSSPVTRFSPLCFYWRNSVRLISWNNGAFSSHQSHYSMQSSCACHTLSFTFRQPSHPKSLNVFMNTVYTVQWLQKVFGHLNMIF